MLIPNVRVDVLAPEQADGDGYGGETVTLPVVAGDVPAHLVSRGQSVQDPNTARWTVREVWVLRLRGDRVLAPRQRFRLSKPEGAGAYTDERVWMVDEVSTPLPVTLHTDNRYTASIVSG